MKRIRQTPWKPALVICLMLGLTACEESGKTTPNSGSEATEHHGLRLDYMDTTVSPKENFFLYANGGYIKQKEIPAEESSWGVFSELRDESDRRVKKILEDVSNNENAEPGGMEQKIGTFYRTGMDSVAVENAGLEPLKGVFAQIDGISSAEDLMTVLAKMHRMGIRAGFGIWFDLDAKDSKSVIANLWQGGMGLPDKDYYLLEGEEKEKMRADYQNYLENLFGLLGDEAKADKAAMVMALETKMAVKSLGRVERRDPYKTYHKYTLEELEAETGLAWGAYFREVGLADPGGFNVGMPDFIKQFKVLTASFSLADWQDYLKLATVRNLGGYLSSDFVQANFDFYGKVLEGTPQMRPRWKRITEHTNHALGMGIGQLYVERHFSPKAKEMAVEMVNNILDEMKKRLSALEWMEEDTRKEGIHKLNTILPKIGYPDKWKDYSEMKISEQAYLKNVLAAKEFAFQFELNKVGKPVDKTEWGMSPQTVNAYYNPAINEIVFPAGILQAPFFDENVEAALNYGGFGAVIGHELTHAFDDQGSKYDAEGNLKNWWTVADSIEFRARSQMVVEQYNAYVVLDSLHVNGELTLGENIADIDGLRISFHAWKSSIAGEPAKEEHGFSPEQRFFVNYGQIWSSLMRPEFLKLMVATNPHSPAEWRVNGSTSSLPEFYEAFGIKDGDAMFREEAKRMKIW